MEGISLFNMLPLHNKYRINQIRHMKISLMYKITYSLCGPQPSWPAQNFHSIISVYKLLLLLLQIFKNGPDHPLRIISLGRQIHSKTFLYSLTAGDGPMHTTLAGQSLTLFAPAIWHRALAAEALHSVM